MIVLSISCASFAGLFALFIAREQPRLALPETLTQSLVIFPDTIRLQGDQLRIDGQFTDKNFLQTRTRVFYQLSSEAEKDWWEKVTQPLAVTVQGTHQIPDEPTNLGAFHYQNYLKYQRIYTTVNAERLEITPKKPANAWSFALFFSTLRKKIIQHIDRAFRAQTASLMKALLIGLKDDDFATLQTSFSKLGILHLFSLSGMHVSLFFRFFRYPFLRAGVTKERVLLLQLLASFVYAGLVNWQISVCRAVLQALFKESNQCFHWQLSALDCWSLALFVHLFINPYGLFTSSGMLSFGLALAIVYVAPLVERIPAIFRSFTFSALLGLCTLPLSSFLFFEWQPSGIFLTFIFLPFFEWFLLPLLLFSFVLSFFLLPTFLVDALELFFQGYQTIISWLEMKVAWNWVIGKPPVVVAILLFVWLFCFLYLFERKKYKLLFFSFGSLFLLLQWKYLNPKGTIAYIDVGQGDSIFLQAPFHQENVLIDTGGQKLFAKEDWATKARKPKANDTILPYLKHKGVATLDKVVITHSHEDHYGDLLAVHQEIPIKMLFFAEGAEKNVDFAHFLLQLKKSGTACYRILGAYPLSTSLNLTALAPQIAGSGENDDSIVLYGKPAAHSFLFTGDLEEAGEAKLLQAYPKLRADVLKVGHHGSQTSTSEAFLQQIKPAAAIISCGRKNRYRHPHQETLQKLKAQQVEIFRTDTQGMIYYEWLWYQQNNPLRLHTVVKKTVAKEENQ